MLCMWLKFRQSTRVIKCSNGNINKLSFCVLLIKRNAKDKTQVPKFVANSCLSAQQN